MGSRTSLADITHHAHCPCVQCAGEPQGPAYRIVPHRSGTEEQFEFALLDPNGLVVARSGTPRPLLAQKQRDLQQAFELGLHFKGKTSQSKPLRKLSRTAQDILRTLRSRRRCLSQQLALITPRYSARILELRAVGHEINTTRLRSGDFQYQYLHGPGRS